MKVLMAALAAIAVGAVSAAEIRGMMLKLGSNTHAEPLDPAKKPANPWDWEHTVSDELRLDEDVWREVTDAMAAKGYNMVVIGLAEGVVYPSHPELAVKGSWSVEKLKAELERLRGMGLEPIPKMNFAASHDTWLGEYHRMVSTKRYYEVCADLIRDVAEIFGHPRFIHLGYDEEMPVAQEKSAYMVVRQGELWWHDFEFFRMEVEKNGARAWIWSDYLWHHRDEFLKRMPKSVLQSNWYYRTDFGETICDRAKMEEKIMSSVWPEYVAGPSAYLDLEAAGFDQLPCGSIWANDACMAATVRFCRGRIGADRLKGFLMAPWLATLKSNRGRLLAAVEIGARAFEAEPQVPALAWGAYGDEVVLRAKPAKGHLQDVWADGHGNLYWAHTLELYRTDLGGKVLAKADVEGHHAGLEARDGRLYVAVCPMQGKTGGKTTPECRVTIGEYDAETLKLLAMHRTDIHDRSGSLAILDDGTFLVGCLRPQDIASTQVRFHHLDRDFKLIKSHVLDDVPVKLGIEVIKRHGDEFYLCMYGTDKDKKPLDFDTVVLGPDFKERRRLKLGAGTGLVFDGTSVWTGWTKWEKDAPGYTSKIRRVNPSSGE